MTAETSNARGEWVLVPRVPTEAMVMAGGYLHPDQHGDAGAVYAAMLAAAPQPPAEAQAQGGGEVELRHMVAKLAAHVRPTCGELWAEAERLLNRTAPPSAPVGVEKVKKALERLDRTIEACAKLTQLLGDGQPHSDLISTAGGQAALAKEAIQRAIAQQPADVVVDDTRGRAK